MKNMFVVFPYEKVEKGASIYIYGCGKVGRTLALQIKRNDYCEICGFVDKKQTESVWGFDVITPNDLYDKKFDYIVVGVLEDNGIREALISLGIDDKRIISLSEKDFLEEDDLKEYPEIVANNHFLPRHLKYKKNWGGGRLFSSC